MMFRMVETVELRSKDRSNLVIGSLSIMAIVLVIGFLFTYWTAQSPDSDYGFNGGTITEKRYTPAHSEEYEACVTARLLCRTETRKVGDRWSVLIKKDGTDKWVNITLYEYNRYEVGGTYISRD